MLEDKINVNLSKIDVMENNPIFMEDVKGLFENLDNNLKTTFGNLYTHKISYSDMSDHAKIKIIGTLLAINNKQVDINFFISNIYLIIVYDYFRQREDK